MHIDPSTEYTNSIYRFALLGHLGLFLILLTMLVVSCSEPIPNHSQFSVGMTRDEVLEKFGKPERSQVMTKSGEAIWGPIEEYWAEIPLGAKVEIWGFKSEITMEAPEGNYKQAGQTELYFVSDSDKVNGLGFYIEGAVYEGSGISNDN